MSDPTQETTMTTTPTGTDVATPYKESVFTFLQLELMHQPLFSTIDPNIKVGEWLDSMQDKYESAMPAAEPTTPAPDGPSTYEQSWMDGYCEGHEDGWQRGLRSASPTTPEPDDDIRDALTLHGVASGKLAERVDGLAEAIASQAQVGMEMQNDDAELYRRLRAHDAALAELRERVGQALDWQWEYTRHGLPSRMEQAEKLAGVPDIFTTTPPAVPDEFMSVPEIDESLVQIVVDMGGARSKGEARRLIAQGGIVWDGETLRVGKRTFTPPDVPDAAEDDTHAMQDWAYERLVIAEAEGLVPRLVVTDSIARDALDVYHGTPGPEWDAMRAALEHFVELGLTPAPPPLVDGEEIANAIQEAFLQNSSPAAVRRALEYFVSRVPAGDDMEDKPYL